MTAYSLPAPVGALADGSTDAPGAGHPGTSHHTENRAPAPPPPPQWNQFTPDRQVVFLDALASTGNVRVSAARAGISHETVYRQRRRCARFAALWAAALHHARPRVEGVIGDRALDGILEEVWFRGELVGERRRYDSRLLLAHMARLDALTARGEAAPHAEWFDAELARLAGHPEPEGFAEAHALWERNQRGYVAPASPPPPTLREFTAWFADRAVDDIEPEHEVRAWEDAAEEAEALYEEWEEGARALVEAILQGEGGERPPAPAAQDAPPIEYKSRALGRAADVPLDTVTCVNTPLAGGRPSARAGADSGAPGRLAPRWPRPVAKGRIPLGNRGHFVYAHRIAGNHRRPAGD